MPDSVYGPARNFAQGMLANLGVETSFYDPSIGAGIEAHHFVIEAVGESARGARSEVTQGYYVVGPADD